MTEIEEDDEEEDFTLESYLEEQIQTRGRQKHISFFGFTGTPKEKTLEIFGTKQPDNKFKPFHVYSMRQSISEGYTLDVLQNYSTYKRYFKVKEVKEESESLSQLFEGIELTEKQIISTFERFKIEQIKSLGEQFDPNIHQAMFEVEKDDQEAGTVAEVVQEGYKIGDRLLRPALVGVVKKKVK